MRIIDMEQIGDVINELEWLGPVEKSLDAVAETTLNQKNSFMLDGPASYDQPCLAVRVRNGMIEVRKARVSSNASHTE